MIETLLSPCKRIKTKNGKKSTKLISRLSPNASQIHYLQHLPTLMTWMNVILPFETATGKTLKTQSQVLNYVCCMYDLECDEIGMNWMKQWFKLFMSLKTRKQANDINLDISELNYISSIFETVDLHHYGENVLPIQWYTIPNLREYLFLTRLYQYLSSIKNRFPLLEKIKRLRYYVQTVRTDNNNFHENLPFCRRFDLLSHEIVANEDELIAIHKTECSHPDMIWFWGCITHTTYHAWSLVSLVRSDQFAMIKNQIKHFTYNLTIKRSVESIVSLLNDSKLYYDMLLLNMISPFGVLYNNNYNCCSNDVSEIAMYEHLILSYCIPHQIKKYDERTVRNHMYRRIAPSLLLGICKLPLPDDIILYVCELLWQVESSDTLNRLHCHAFVRRQLNKLLEYKQKTLLKNI